MTSDPGPGIAHSAGEAHPAIKQLLFEHELMRDVLRVMDVESNRVLSGGPLRFEVWSKIVDFNGNFVHLCHRVKEEEVLVPLLVQRGLIEDSARVENKSEHARAKQLTLGLIAGFEAGDWEKVHRLSSLYTHLHRSHMAHEEEWMQRLSLDGIEPSFLDSIEAVNRSALGERGLAHYLKLVRELCETAGVTPGSWARA